MGQSNKPSREMVIVSPGISIWSGGVRISRDEDLVKASESLPPKELVSDGAKHLIDTSNLKVLHTLRKRVERILREDGFSWFIGGAVALPETIVDDRLAKIEVCKKEFNAHVEWVCANLPRLYQQQQDKYPDWADMLKRSELTVAQVRHRFAFGVGAFRVTAPTEGQAAEAYETMIGEQALPAMLESIAKDASKAASKLKGRKRARNSQLDPIRHLAGKLDSFSFIDPRVGPVATELLASLAGIIASDGLTEGETNTLRLVANRLADIKAIVREGEAAMVGDDESIETSDEDDIEEIEAEATDTDSGSDSVPAPAQPKPIPAEADLGFSVNF